MAGIRNYRRKHFNGGMPPPQSAIHAAVLAACTETGAKFSDVMQLQQNFGRGNAQLKYKLISRSRIYAGLALRAIFMEQCDDVVIARVLFASDGTHWFYQIDHKMREGMLQNWWSDEVFMRVLEAIEAAMATNKRIEQAAE